jgi:hypothetical protein
VASHVDVLAILTDNGLCSDGIFGIKEPQNLTRFNAVPSNFFIVTASNDDRVVMVNSWCGPHLIQAFGSPFQGTIPCIERVQVPIRGSVEDNPFIRTQYTTRVNLVISFTLLVFPTGAATISIVRLEFAGPRAKENRFTVLCQDRA